MARARPRCTCSAIFCKSRPPRDSGSGFGATRRAAASATASELTAYRADDGAQRDRLATADVENIATGQCSLFEYERYCLGDILYRAEVADLSASRHTERLALLGGPEKRGEETVSSIVEAGKREWADDRERSEEHT